LAATFAAMLATAKIFSKSEAKHERQPKAPASAGVGTQLIWPPHAEPASRVAAMPLLKSDSSSAARTHGTDTIV